MIRFFFYLVLAIAFTWCGATVKLGSRTFFGHVKAVWSTDEAQDMKQGVEQGARPMVEKVKRGVEAGYREATRDESPTGGAAPRTPDQLEERAERSKRKGEIDPGDVQVAPPDAGVRVQKPRRKAD